jgi:hypothetical protein
MLFSLLIRYSQAHKEKNKGAVEQSMQAYSRIQTAPALTLGQI